jgi:molybdopterin converting factor small subunit
MNVTVKFIGVFRNASGRSRFTFSLWKRVSLGEALNSLVKQLPGLKQALSHPKSNMLILVNGKEIGILNGLDTLLKNGDEVVLVPVLHGG